MNQPRRTPARLLIDSTQPRSWTINLKLQNNQWAQMQFSDRQTAQQQYDQFRINYVCGGQPIKEIEFQENFAPIPVGL